MFWIKLGDSVFHLDANKISDIIVESFGKPRLYVRFFSGGGAWSYYDSVEEAEAARETLLGLMGIIKVYTIEDIQNLALNKINGDNIQPTESCHMPPEFVNKIVEQEKIRRVNMTKYLEKEAEKYAKVFE